MDSQPNSEGSQFTAPQISLPKGGGAIRGIGEKFSANAVTGTGSLSVPIAVSPSRSTFGPQLSLTYDSGSGNGVFGVGWNLGLPAISRKTDKGIPRYSDHEESDVFIISGAEDLVPVLHQTQDREWAYSESERDGYALRLYRPRIEGLFARIARWTRMENGDIHWRSFSKDNVLTIYGGTPESRISDADQPSHVFQWLISSSHDVRGNAILYEYVAENDLGVDLSRPSERRRTRSANRYLKRIRYGNRKPLERNRAELETGDWMFEIVFDFGEEAYEESAPSGGRESVVRTAHRSDALSWPARKDPFSTYRSGFEVRTHRLCRRTLLFHHFPLELETPRYLVRSTGFEYREKPIGSFLTSVIQSGYTLEANDRYLKRSLPSLDLAYTLSPLEDKSPGPFELTEADSRNLPEGIDGANYRWLDLDGEGISGVLAEQGAGWYYKHNLGKGHFGVAQLVARKPSTGRLNSRQQQLMDVAGDGGLDLVELSAGSAGFYERTPNGESGEEGWARFRAFQSFPVQDWNDPNLRFVDLTGDGIADVIVTEDVAIRWHPSLLQRGFGAGVRIPTPQDEEQGARVVFADRTQSIYLADMSGDGLADIVRIRNGELCYWPNLGYGRFGAKVSMDGAPWFDAPNLFDQRRLRLADTDGSGTTDIVYLSDDGIHVYLNQSGNGWSERRLLRGAPCADVRSISVTDFLGRGTACLVWSSPLPSDSQRPLRYVDLMHGQKPHLLTRISNNLGAETVVEYASSTEFYLADQAAGKPWVTRLPFPVHVVKRVETYDSVSRDRFVTASTYHHGYYDGVEREFRGFGRVEQTDTEEFGALHRGSEFPASTNEDAAWRVPAVLTKTWYHTGVFLGLDRVSRHLAHEYYREPHETAAMRLEDTVLPSGLTPEEAREACRALKGSMLRQEVYALDGSEKSARPYTVGESNSTIRLLQPRGRNRHAVFFTHAREGLTFHYERQLYEIAGVWRADPRVTHAVTLEVDDYGNILRSVNIGYGRRFPGQSVLLTDSDRDKQSRILATLTDNRFTNAVNKKDDYRTPLQAGACSYEILHLRPQSNEFGVTNLFRFTELWKRIQQASDGQHDLPFEDLDGAQAIDFNPYRRLFQESRFLYRSDQLDRLLPLGEVEALALPGESYRLTLTSGVINKVYRRAEHGRVENLLPDAKPVLGKDCGYVDLDHNGHWWAPSGRVFYSPHLSDDAYAELAYARQHFFVARRFRDAFGNTSTVTYDAHDLAPIETRDPIGNVVLSLLDYRVLLPRQVADANGNRSRVAYDALGMVAGSAVMGKEGQKLGDSLEGFHADLPESVVLEHIRRPLQDPHSVLGNASMRLIYDLFAYERTRGEAQPQPAASYALTRETHVSDLAPGERTKIQHSFSYSDGLGREIQKKLQAEPGAMVDGGPIVDPRWVGSGWTIFNNKGKPVRQYEPFFTATHHFEFAVMAGVSATLFYDPTERVVATLHPNHTFEKLNFDPWRQESWDVNDTILQTDPAADFDVGGFFQLLPVSDYSPTWYTQRVAGGLGPQEQEAANKGATHANTPTTSYFDTLGRTFLTVVDNGGGVKFSSRVELDIQANQRAVRDAMVQAGDPHGRIVMRYDYDMLQNRIQQASMEADERWTLNDCTAKAIRSWDSRGHNFRTEYDVLRRPTHRFVLGTDNLNSDPRTTAAEVLYEKIVYGEGQPSPEILNLRTRVFQQYDAAGVVTNRGHNPDTNREEGFDFKGNLLRSRRGMAADYKTLPDLTALPPPPDVFTSSTQYDALNRPAVLTAPDGSVIRPSYNEANLLESLNVDLRGAAGATPFVTNIDYNAKAQRILIAYGNANTETEYTYDPLTFRLASLTTARPGAPADQRIVQDLAYTYDPVGNITHIQDDADIQDIIFFRNRRVEPSSDYTYDAIYRLIRASGREQLGLNGGGKPLSPAATSYNDVPRVRLTPLQGDGNAVGTYSEQYHYDAVGNFLQFVHRGANPADPGWTRSYSYNQASLLESGKVSNRLSSTAVSGHEPLNEPYSYDLHGNMTSMPQLQAMQWDFKDELLMTRRQAVNVNDQDGTLHQGERTYYVYDSAGQRVRKTTESSAGIKTKERFYLGSFELYREFDANGNITLARETLHVMDDKKRVALVETKTIDTSVPQVSAPSTTTRYQFDNHLGTACLELDETAAVITYEEYYPYGSTSYQAGRTLAEVSLKRYRYTGKERDEETGFCYHGARYYAPWLGRWNSPESVESGDGLNVYVYVRNNPVRFTDPTGRYSWSDFGSDVWGGVKGAARGIVEPALIVMDFGQMGAAMVTHEFFPKYYHDVEWLSATGKRIEQGTPGWRAGLVVATAMPTGGGSGLVDNVSTVFEKDMSPEEARSFLVQGAVAQSVSAAVGASISKTTGSGWTGRGPVADPMSDAAMLRNLAKGRVEAGKAQTGDATFAQGRDASGNLTRVMESDPDEGGSHAEPKVKSALSTYGGRSMAVDQIPCDLCWPELSGAPKPQQPGFFSADPTGSLRVFVPRNPENMAQSPKTAALKAAAGKINPVGQEVLRVPFAPPVVQYQSQPRCSANDEDVGPTPAEVRAQQSLPPETRYR